MDIVEFFGRMPPRNLHTEVSATAAKCLLNRAEDCAASLCMAWRWMREDGVVVTALDDDTGEQLPCGWCGLAAYPLVGERPS
jgi:hypothetical protein